MNVHGVGLALALCCVPMVAQQQVLVSSVVSHSESSLLESFSPTATAMPDASIGKATALVTDSPALPQMLVPSPLYEAALPQLPPAVCTQALFPTIGLPQSDYVFDHLTLSSSAIKGAFTHDHMVKMARNFVPGQPLPDAPTYVPLTSRQKFDLFVRNIHSPGFGFGVLADSLIAQASGAYPKFGGGMEGYGNRLGAAAAGEGAAAFIGGYIFPTLLHQDPRYFRSHQNGITDRLAYAASRVSDWPQR